MAEREHAAAAVNLLRERLASGRLLPARRALHALNPSEIADLLESLPPRQRAIVWNMVSPEDDGEVLLHLGEDVRDELIKQMDVNELVAAAEELDIDDLADFIEHLPETVTQQVLKALDADDRARLESVLAYEPDTAGGLMNTDTVTVRPDVTLDVVQRYLRLRGELPSHTDALFVVDRYAHYLGALPLAAILTRAPDELVSGVMERDRETMPATMKEEQVAQRFEHADLVSAPVLDERNRLIGRITIDDVVDVIRRESEHKLMSMAGLDEDEDIFAPVRGAAKRRAIWLGINLLTAFLASSVVDLFEGSISKVVALAVLMPVVASMGGIGGSQTLTLMIRGLALGQIGWHNWQPLLRKELAVAAVNGVLWALVVGTTAWIWFHSPLLALVVGMAIVINQTIAALAGIFVPLTLKKFGVDPALAGSVILTTFTDVCGFFSLLSLGTLILL
ncbi:magnesium transporter [Solimonas soli]|uniref:magnesium transporter n=1 Tax=Solimonas soli TaxID=413479 RepID=UPI000483DBF8|nr:magnesium transporter [Solimonas soli]